MRLAPFDAEIRRRAAVDFRRVLRVARLAFLGLSLLSPISSSMKISAPYLKSCVFCTTLTWTFSSILPAASLNVKNIGRFLFASIPALTRASVSAARRRKRSSTASRSYFIAAQSDGPNAPIAPYAPAAAKNDLRVTDISNSPFLIFSEICRHFTTCAEICQPLLR